MMFRMSSQGKILHHVIMDFQITRIGSPRLDISYFMYTSVKHDVRHQHWRDLLKIYYDSFCLNVQQLHGTVDFSFEDFISDYRKKFVAGFIFGICTTGSFEAYRELENLDNVRGDPMNYINEVIAKWIQNNSDKTQKCAQQLGGLFQDFKELISD